MAKQMDEPMQQPQMQTCNKTVAQWAKLGGRFK